MKWVVPITMLVFIGLAVMMGKGLYHGLFPGKPQEFKLPPRAESMTATPVKTEKLEKETESGKPELVFVESGPMVPGCLVTKGLEVYQEGQLSTHGYVEDIQDNVAKCIVGAKAVFVVFSRARLQVRPASFFGMTSKDAVCTSAGTFVKGQEVSWGQVVEVTPRSVKIVRVDGGILYIAPDLKFADEHQKEVVAQSGNIEMQDVSTEVIDNAKSTVVAPSY